MSSVISRTLVGYQRGESFDTETQWDNRGDIGVVGSHQELAEMTARPESSTPNKNPGLMLKKDTPRPCPKSTGNLLSDSAESRSPEYIYVTSEKVSENKALQQSVSGFSFKDNDKDSKSSTPDTLVRGRKRPVSSPEDRKVSPNVSPIGSGSSPKIVTKNKKRKSENKTPLRDTVPVA